MKSTLIVTLLLAAPVAGSALACDEVVSCRTSFPSGVSAGAVGQKGGSGSRAIEVRLEGGRVSATVDGEPVPEARIRREGDRIVIVDAAGAPIAGLPPISLPSSSAGTVVVRTATAAGHGDGDIDLDLNLEGVDAAQIERLLEQWGPKIQAEVKRAVDEAMAGANRAAGEVGRWAEGAGQAADVLRRYFVAPGSHFAQPAEVAPAPKVMLGVTLDGPDAALCRHLGIKEDQATLLADVRPALPAAMAGLEPFDVVVEVNGSAPADPATIRSALANASPGDTLRLRVRRAGETRDFVVPLEAFDPARLGDGGGAIEVQVSPDAQQAPLARMLRDRLRLAPLQTGRGDFVFELDDSGAAQRVPGVPLPPAPPAPGAPGAGPAARGGQGPDPEAMRRLERLEQRIDQMSDRLERLLQRMEKNER